jgi:hypothetical protein
VESNTADTKQTQGGKTHGFLLQLYNLHYSTPSGQACNKKENYTTEDTTGGILFYNLST